MNGITLLEFGFTYFEVIGTPTNEVTFPLNAED